MSVANNFSNEPYIGFTLDDITSDQLGVTRVNTGDRMEEKLSPDFSEIVTNVPGTDGQYYFGSRYTQKTIPINFAFDGLTEIQLARLKEKLNGKGIHTLKLAEYPDRSWKVKSSGDSVIKYIPFEENRQRVYKGEGNTSFITCSIYALGEVQSLELEESPLTIDNQGDVPIIYKIYVTTQGATTVELSVDESEDNSMTINFASEGEWILDSHSQTITKVGDPIKNRIYNNFITSGSFPTIGIGEKKLTYSITGTATIKIEYNLLYL